MLILNKKFDEMYSSLDNALDMLTNRHVSYRNSSYKEYDEYLDIKLIVPGYSKDDLSIKISEDILQITSEDSKIESSYRLPKSGVDLESISAECKNGILSINIPKIKPKVKEVSVKIK